MFRLFSRCDARHHCKKTWVSCQNSKSTNTHIDVHQNLQELRKKLQSLCCHSDCVIRSGTVAAVVAAPGCFSPRCSLLLNFAYLPGWRLVDIRYTTINDWNLQILSCPVSIDTIRPRVSQSKGVSHIHHQNLGHYCPVGPCGVSSISIRPGRLSVNFSSIIKISSGWLLVQVNRSVCAMCKRQ